MALCHSLPLVNWFGKWSTAAEAAIDGHHIATTEQINDPWHQKRQLHCHRPRHELASLFLSLPLSQSDDLWRAKSTAVWPLFARSCDCIETIYSRAKFRMTTNCSWHNYQACFWQQKKTSGKNGPTNEYKLIHRQRTTRETTRRVAKNICSLLCMNYLRLSQNIPVHPSSQRHSNGLMHQPWTHPGIGLHWLHNSPDKKTRTNRKEQEQIKQRTAN